MKKQKLISSLILSLVLIINNVIIANAQNGDQILDGIGETGMVARYVFSGDVKDWSRNNLHAKYVGVNPQFQADSRFGKVLSLSGNSDSFVQLPEDVLENIESFSISGWIYLRSDNPGQHLFDFGEDKSKHMFATPVGVQSQRGFQFSITNGTENRTTAASPAIEMNKWVFLSVVMDASSKSVLTYVDGQAAGKAENVEINFTTILNGNNIPKNQLYIGKSMIADAPNLNALLHDFRIYRIALNNEQVAGIYKNALNGNQESTVNVGKQRDNLQHFVSDHPQLYNIYLSSVADVEVETQIGNLPRLPSFVQGTYLNGIKGPLVRVLWPSATDNTSVLKSGIYNITGRVSGTDFHPKAVVNVKEAVKLITPSLKLQAFDLDQVYLDRNSLGQKTKFIRNRDKFIYTLAETDPDSFLYMFRDVFGQKQPEGAKPLGVWDSEDTKLRGHATGHYLSAIAQAYASTAYDKVLQAKLYNKMQYMVNTLFHLSKLSGSPKTVGEPFVNDPTEVSFGAGKTEFDSDLSAKGIRNDYWNWGKGYISAYPPDQFIMLEKGAKYGGQNNQIWAPYYTLHKILAGLMDVYEVSGNKKALTVATNMGDWVYDRLSKLPEQTLIKMWNTYIAGEYGGMNDAMARLYKITGNQKYLKTAKLFDNVRIFFGDVDHSNGLAKNVDLFRGTHANQHIPQIVGSIEMYNVSRKSEYYKVADNFWHKAVNDYMYSIGGFAGARNPPNAECFISEPATLYQNGFSEGGQNETCATYNMLKLTSHLFLFDQRGELMDYYERGLYNDILASVAEHSPANTYHISLLPGSAKQFSNADMTGFTCCNGTALESSTKLQNSIYFKSKDDKALFVNLYIPSTLHWKSRNITIVQTTTFPEEDHTQLTVKGSGSFDIDVRVPGWATNGFFVKINGKAQVVKAEPGTYLTLNRTWKNGDIIDLKMPFNFHLDPVMDQQNIASLFYGPILLAAQETEARKDWRKITLDAHDISKSITGDPQKLQFTIDNVLFKPFYESYGRYSVYLDVTLN